MQRERNGTNELCGNECFLGRNGKRKDRRSLNRWRVLNHRRNGARSAGLLSGRAGNHLSGSLRRATAAHDRRRGRRVRSAERVPARAHPHPV